ncbi:hypothetical protein [Nocardia bhagyanarayanae]|uniref:Uncharacterized protein n=1 Tax=Nocardia bhagyanarayanae TaxID=1215925 RepID=A0A543F7Q4_9NOCA|nr:hypothetical protein [Nocardia bhagyanarayanae]TQM29855.1 hypothetical protein FB390_1468 [Nocardia bhagyanarayanae]
MTFYLINPEVPADFGQVSRDSSYDPPRVVSAHFEFYYPVDSELITSYSGAYAVTKPLADALTESDLTGYEFGPVTTSISALVEDPDRIIIPPLTGLVITGRAFSDDFGIQGRSKLIASERAAEFLWNRDARIRDGANKLDKDGNIVLDF